MTTPAPTILLDSDTALRLLAEVVAEKGADYVYPAAHLDPERNCRYLYNGEPDCIVACVLVKAGVPVEVLAEHEYKQAFLLPLQLGSVTLSSNARTLLDHAQRVQDLAASPVSREWVQENANWGKALDAARSLYASMQ